MRDRTAAFDRGGHDTAYSLIRAGLPGCAGPAAAGPQRPRHGQGLSHHPKSLSVRGKRSAMFTMTFGRRRSLLKTCLRSASGSESPRPQMSDRLGGEHRHAQGTAPSRRRWAGSCARMRARVCVMEWAMGRITRWRAGRKDGAACGRPAGTRRSSNAPRGIRRTAAARRRPHARLARSRRSRRGRRVRRQAQRQRRARQAPRRPAREPAAAPA